MKISPILALAILLGLPQAGADELLIQGQKLLRAGEARRALSLFDQVKQRNPADPRPYFYTGMALAGSQPKEALSEFERAIELAPGQAEFHLVYAETLARMDQKSAGMAALTAFNDAAIVGQLDARELWLLSDIHFRLESYEGAEKTLGLYASKYPRDPRIPYRFGEIFLKLGQLDRSQEFFQRLIDTNPDKAAPGYYGLGHVLYLKNELDRSRQALLKAIEMAPRTADFLVLLGTVLVAMDRPDEALNWLRTMEDDADRFPRIHHGLARAYRRLGDLDQSKFHFEKFREIDRDRKLRKTRSEQAQIRVTKAQDYMAGGSLNQARQELKAALEIDPNHFLANKYLAQISLSSKAWRTAQVHISRMRDTRPESVEGMFLQARLWYQTGDLDRARESAEAAKGQQPGNAEVRNLLGNIYFGQGDKEKAAEEYRAAVTLQPENEAYRLNYQMALRRLDGGR